MNAKKYSLMASAFTGSIYVGKVSKRNPNEMTGDRQLVPDSDFIPALLAWVENKMDGKDTLTITAGGEPILLIKQVKNGIND